MVLYSNILGTEQTVSAANAFNGATLLRIYNHNGADVLVTLVNCSTDYASATVTIKAGTVEYIRKDPAGTVACATSCKIVPVSF